MGNVIQITSPFTAAVQPGGTVTMTSLEMVDFINKDRMRVHLEGGKAYVELRHDHFLAKVVKVLGADHAPNFWGMIEVAIGKGATRKSPAYVLPKREAVLLAMSYSFELQAQVYDFMTRLEIELAAATQKPSMVPTTFAEALRLAADKAEEVERLALTVQRVEAEVVEKVEQLAIAAPKVKTYDEFIDKGLCKNMRDTATELNIYRDSLTEFMVMKGWIYQSGSGSQLY